MKFAKFTLSLLAVALFAGAPGSAFAGNGLLDGGCGCASQKSCGCGTGHVVQKGSVVQNGYVHQKGSIVQNGHIHQKGDIIQKGGIAQKGCSSGSCGGCGSCSICLPRILPALVHGIDAVLNKVFACHGCGSSKGGCGCATQKGHFAQKGHISQKGDSCGCATQKGHFAQKGHISQKGDSCGCGSPYSTPSNPFIEDLQSPPVQDIDGDARFVPRRTVTRPVSHDVEVPTRSVIKSTSATSREPRALPAELVSPREDVRQASTARQAKPDVIRTSSTTNSGLVVPSNPLR